jgi:hypothetical protein
LPEYETGRSSMMNYKRRGGLKVMRARCSGRLSVMRLCHKAPRRLSKWALQAAEKLEGYGL